MALHASRGIFISARRCLSCSGCSASRPRPASTSRRKVSETTPSRRLPSAWAWPVWPGPVWAWPVGPPDGGGMDEVVSCSPLSDSLATYEAKRGRPGESTRPAYAKAGSVRAEHPPSSCYVDGVKNDALTLDDEFRLELATRRQNLRRALGDDVLVLFSAPEHVRNGDVSHPYRQDSDFYYITGFEEPESVCILRRKEPGFVLFVRPRDPEKEIWDGRRAGEVGAVERFGADVAHPIGKLAELLPDYFEDVARVHYFFGRQNAWDRSIFDAIAAVAARRRKKVTAPTQLVNATELLHSARRIKSSFEVAQMQRAASVTVAAHRRALLSCRPGWTEHDLAAELEHEFRRGGAKREAYESIVASGDNATILHYRENDRRMNDGELVLIDAGTEVGYYAADLTATFPVGSAFSPAQKHLYQLVLDAHRAALSVCRAGSTIELVHRAAFEVIRDGLAALGWISGSGEELDRAATRYFMHRTSHYLGMDVHDVGPYHTPGAALPLEPGVAITVEPGIYVQSGDLAVPAEFRGIGIRIEDDVVITHGDPLVLTRELPREVSEIESLRRSSRSA